MELLLKKLMLNWHDIAPPPSPWPLHLQTDKYSTFIDVKDKKCIENNNVFKREQHALQKQTNVDLGEAVGRGGESGLQRENCILKY